MLLSREREASSINEKKFKNGLSVFGSIVFVKGYSIRSRCNTYRITEFKTLNNKLRLGLNVFEYGKIFTETELQKILLKHGLTINDINISNRR